MNIQSEVYTERAKEEVLNSIERGAKEAADYRNGKLKLKDANDILNELSCCCHN